MFTNVLRRRRRLAKTLVYRAASVVATVVVAYALLGDVGVAVDVGLAANALKMGLYYVHEWTWEALLPPVDDSQLG